MANATSAKETSGTVSVQDAQFKPVNSHAKIAFASFIGTAIEFYDFYIYGLASALFLGALFFPSENPSIQQMLSFLSFAVAFFARPFGSIFFGHFGDKYGRKKTLVASLLMMGVSTVLIGCLPTYAAIGIAAPLLLCLLRFGQGLGLGGEWGGAALMATENAPSHLRAIFSIYPQIGPPIGFILATLIMIVIQQTLTSEQQLSWGWRIPFIVSIVMIALGLYVRLTIVESPVFQHIMERRNTRKIPGTTLFRKYFKEVILGSVVAMSCFTLFFLTTVFSLQYETHKHTWQQQAFFSETTYLTMLLLAIIFMALASPISGYMCEKLGRRPTLVISGLLCVGVGLIFGPAMNCGDMTLMFIFLCCALLIMGLLFTPLAAFLPEIFPVDVRYTGASLSFSIGGILGGSLTPFFAAWLTSSGDINSINNVGYYLVASSLISIFAVLMLKETKQANFAATSAD